MRSLSRSSRVRRAAALALAGLALTLLTGCARFKPSEDYTAPGAVPPGPNSAVLPTASSTAGTAGPGQSVGSTPRATPATGPWTLGRPMTAWEKQYRDECQRGIVQNGCKYFTDQSLELQGVNPFS
ncbi:MAG: hypothetical protein QOD82_1751 [Pseudonocardiales bacterium]|nr:hypothetical protein [Pseudonocardia sp.]MDT7673849.1 hypothetical protein [Pseudonocardiales bacterium]